MSAVWQIRTGRAACIQNRRGGGVYVLQEATHSGKSKLLIGRIRASPRICWKTRWWRASAQSARMWVAGRYPNTGSRFLTIKHKADAGIVISASHNSF